MDAQKLTDRESTTIDIIKAISILFVITVHVVPLSDTNLYTKIVSSLWVMFANTGVVAFFIIGGFLYSRSDGDGKIFWKKKFYRIIIPWAFCSTLTYIVAVILKTPLSIAGYFKWILGSRTWYYYITIYTFFLFIFKLFYKKDIVLYCLIGVQIISLILITFNFSTTLPISFFNDYLNPLHWIGYFSAGILIRRHRIDRILQEHKFITIISTAVMLAFAGILYAENIYTYFNILSMVFFLSVLILIAALAYKLAGTKVAAYIRKIGTSSYCIYLLHMQIVQWILSKVPDNVFKTTLSPFAGLGIMMILVSLGLFICKKLPFGDKLKMLVGL